MFNSKEKRRIAEAVESVLREINHPEMGLEVAYRKVSGRDPDEDMVEYPHEVEMWREGWQTACDTK